MNDLGDNFPPGTGGGLLAREPEPGAGLAVGKPIPVQRDARLRNASRPPAVTLADSWWYMPDPYNQPTSDYREFERYSNYRDGVETPVTSPGFDWHYHRNNFNNPPPTRAEAEAQGWKEQDESMNRYHQFGPGGKGNAKFLGRDGREEGVYDSGGNLVTYPRNAGTYNYVSPNNRPGLFGHFLLDVMPYWARGNGYGDPTPILQRIFGARR